jgi:ABC-type sugar transport system ATPase subunit
MLSAGAPIRVQMEDIGKSFGAIKSLDRVNLVLRAGEVLGLVGDNGAGKSTLGKILSGAVVPDSGRILLDSREVRPPMRDASGSKWSIKTYRSAIPSMSRAISCLDESRLGTSLACRSRS